MSSALHSPLCSSHNWNALFLGANAVANAMSSKYGIDKSQLLDAESSQSLGVRMALGETEIVNETREFLLHNGVSLDSFSQVCSCCPPTVCLSTWGCCLNVVVHS